MIMMLNLTLLATILMACSSTILIVNAAPVGDQLRLEVAEADVADAVAAITAQQQQQQQYNNMNNNEKQLKLSSSDHLFKKKQPVMKDGSKKEWRKLVDNLNDNRPALEQTMVSVPVARRRQPVAQQQKHSYDDSASQLDAANEQSLLLIKRKPGVNLSEDTHSPSLLAINQNNLDQTNQQQTQQQLRQLNPVDLAEHRRRILNDDFNIRRDSIFTTNNHLGHKEPPKFGSEEQF